jgi:hypothetical protein
MLSGDRLSSLSCLSISAGEKQSFVMFAADVIGVQKHLHSWKMKKQKMNLKKNTIFFQRKSFIIKKQGGG